MARFSGGGKGDPQHMMACNDDRSCAARLGNSSRRWNCTGTKPPCVTRCRSTVCASASALKDGITTRVPPATIVLSIATQLMFEYSPSEQTVTAPLW